MSEIPIDIAKTSNDLCRSLDISCGLTRIAFAKALLAERLAATKSERDRSAGIATHRPISVACSLYDSITGRRST